MTVLENIKIGFHINTKTNLFDALLHTRRYQQDKHFIAICCYLLNFLIAKTV